MRIGLKKEKLLWMAGEITLARRRIREALRLMQCDEDKDFFLQCYNFEKEQFKQFAPFYLFESPEFLDAVRHGDPDAAEEALLFLEADPYCFRSGYIRKKLCRALKQAPLDREKRSRIRSFVLRAVCIQRPLSFKAVASLGVCFYTPGFHERAEKLKIIPFKYIIARKKMLLKMLAEAKNRRKSDPACASAFPADAPVPESIAASPDTMGSSLKKVLEFFFSFFSASRD
jgi:hypothetical protein